MRIRFYLKKLVVVHFIKHVVNISVLRPIGVIGGGVEIPVTIVGSVALLLFLLRYV